MFTSVMAVMISKAPTMKPCDHDSSVNPAGASGLESTSEKRGNRLVEAIAGSKCRGRMSPGLPTFAVSLDRGSYRI